MEEIILKFIIKIKTGNDEFFVSKDDLYNEWIYNCDMKLIHSKGCIFQKLF